MKILLFAYGSNMKTERMVDRVPSARFVGRAFIPDKKLVYNKRSKDGSGKANIVNSPEDTVWGIVYEIDDSQLDKLDRVEGGYTRLEIVVIMDNGTRKTVQVYVSGQYTDNPVPFEWYKNIILQGAREHNLPLKYIKQLEEIQSKTK